MSLITLAVLAGCSNGLFGKGEDPNGTDTAIPGEDDTGEIIEDTGEEVDPNDVDDDGDGLTENEGDCDDENADIGNIEEIPYDGLDNDCDESTPDDDLDGDGYTVDEDCDDQSAKVGPAEEEVPYDGVDNDCDEDTPDDDLDGDGYTADEDCDDNDAGAFPGADETWGNEIDDDCDGETDERFESETVVNSCDCGDVNTIAVDSALGVHIGYRNADDSTVYYIGGTSNSWGTSSQVTGYSGSGDYMDSVVDGADNFQIVYTWYYGTDSSGYPQGTVDMNYRSSNGSWAQTYPDYYEVDEVFGAWVNIDVDNSNLPSFGYFDASFQYGALGVWRVPVVADYTSFGVAVYSMVDEHLFGDTGYYSTLAIDSAGDDHMAYYDTGASWPNGEVQYQKPINILNGTLGGETVYEGGAADISLALKSDDTPCVAFQETDSADLYYGCKVSDENWAIETVVTSGNTGNGAQLAFNSEDVPYIAYYNTTTGAASVSLKDEHYGWISVDLGQGTGPTLSVDYTDTVHVAWYGSNNGVLKYSVGN
jgi:hypothetical protein